MRHITLAILTFVSATCAAAPGDAPKDYRYKVETLIEGMPQPMQLQIAPDGRIFFIEIQGKVKIFHPDTRKVVEAASLPVFFGQENGLLGMALDPDFARNHWIYLLHSPVKFNGQHLSRYTVNGNTLDLASEKILLTFEEQRKECCHHAGALRFGPDGTLYFSTGDNTNPFSSDGRAPIDQRPNRSPWDAGKSSANTNDLRGKINRIKPTPDGGYTIPPGNLFPPGTPMTRPEIFVMGCRNPWRFNVDQKTGILYYGDVGNDAGGDSAERGPRGYDLINQVRKASNYGWPFFRGNNYPYAAFDFATGKAGSKFDPAHPLNDSPNNTGLRELPPAQPAWIYYPQGTSKEFPILGSGGRTACAGPVFHYKPGFEKTGGLPAFYDGCLLIYDWSRPFLFWVRLDKDQNMQGIEPFSGAVKVRGDQAEPEPGRPFPIRRPVDMVFGEDGALYLLDYGTTWGPNKDSRLLKISFQHGNIAPLAVATGKNTAGREPLDVELSSEGTKDLDGDAVTYEWRLQPGGAVISKEANAKLTLKTPGNFTAELRVTDSHGAGGTATVPLLVGNAAPEVRFESPQDGDFFFPGKPVAYKVAVKDFEDGDSAAKSDDFGLRTLVAADWTQAGGKENIDPGLARMKQSDCFNCHAIEQKIVGPPLVEIATKYRGQAGAAEATIQRVITGSTGIWGQLPMLPHPQHTADEVAMMVKWVFGLEKGKAGPAVLRGLTGEILAPKDGNIRAGVLEATYTDLGRSPVASLSGKVAVRLRTSRLEAESGNEIRGAQTLNQGSASGRRAVRAKHSGESVKFTGLNLATCGTVTFRLACGGTGGTIEIRAGAADGKVLANAEVKPTEGWEKWVEITAPIKPGAGRGDIFIVFGGPQASGDTPLFDLDCLEFNPR
jgi:cytochrome c